jgi:pfkB family carbohydrate kinase
MIVIVGSPVGRLVDGRLGPGGLAARAAVAAASAGRAVQLVGRIGDDPDADRLMLALASTGVAHVAVLRDPSRATPIELDGGPEEPPDASADAVASDAEGGDEVSARPAPNPIALDAADVELGLRYLTDYRVVVLTPAGPDVVAVAADAARWATARLVVVVDGPDPSAGSAAEAPPSNLPPDAIVLEAPDADPDGAFAALVGRLAAALDTGADPATAFRDVISEAGWATAAGDG